MWISNLLLVLFLQGPVVAPPKVVVGLIGGQQVVVENAEFSGFIQGHVADGVLTYRQEKLHGRISVNTISRIEFGQYRSGQPFVMTVRLKNGQTLEVEAERSNFVTLTGKTDIGVVTIKHPDPTSPKLRISTHRPDRFKDLTIQYLEFPAS
jgi:hypothetical protein